MWDAIMTAMLDADRHMPCGNARDTYRDARARAKGHSGLNDIPAKLAMAPLALNADLMRSERRSEYHEGNRLS